jgi:hypothetical protein
MPTAPQLCAMPAHCAAALSAEQCPAGRGRSRSGRSAIVVVAVLSSICQPCVSWAPQAPALALGGLSSADLARPLRRSIAVGLHMSSPEEHSERRCVGQSHFTSLAAPILRASPCSLVHHPCGRAARKR